MMQKEEKNLLGVARVAILDKASLPTTITTITTISTHTQTHTRAHKT
jgi:hypothetical protein